MERPLGRGGMGEVYLAFHEQLGKRVAIKVLQAEAALDPSVRARFRREAVAASTLASAHIAEVSDVGELPPAAGSVVGQPFMVMEYLQGRDLAAHLAERGALGLAEAVDVLAQLCEGVRVAHAAGVVHRDLKPANLFLVPRAGATPLVKILDFGIAKTERNLVARDSHEPPARGVPAGLTHLTGYGGMLGSVRYMAPEQMESARDVDGRADIWSIGIIGYKLLAGRVPFEAESIEALFVAMITQPFLPLRGLRPDAPSALVDAIEGCLRPNRDERWPSIEAVAAMLALARAALGSDHPPRAGGLGGAPPWSITQSPTLPLWSPPDLAAASRVPPASSAARGGLLLALAGLGLAGLVVVASLSLVWGPWRLTEPLRGAGPAASQNQPVPTPGYALSGVLVDPVALLPQALAKALSLSPGPPFSLQKLRVFNAGPGPLRLTGDTIILFELVRPGQELAVTVTYLASRDFASTFELGNDARIVTPPRCGFEEARTAAVAAGYTEGPKSIADYGGARTGAWRFHNLSRNAKPRFVDVDATTCAGMLPEPSSFDVRR